MPPIDNTNLEVGQAQLCDRIHKNKQGIPLGVFSVCSSHQTVLESTLKHAACHDYPILVESTCNQVNQFGGYTGKTPSQFSTNLLAIASQLAVPPSRLILGGDHLGPYPWRSQPAQAAMAHACKLVQDCVAGGYSKIHLDASMHCADDNPDEPLPLEISASRTTELCRVAESSAGPFKYKPLYIIGSEVPAPGGEQALDKMQVTRTSDLADTILVTRLAFQKRGLEKAWERVIGVVVQPGVEYYDRAIQHYDPCLAAMLSAFIEHYPGLIYEAHSTDYQTGSSLKRMVRDHFAILKVGPELTFAYREMVFSLEQIELEMARFQSGLNPSHISQVIDQVMIDHPQQWSDYYSGTGGEQSLSRKYSYLDRIRYYWNKPWILEALKQLFGNLSAYPIPPGLISQYLPAQHQQIIQGRLSLEPPDWIDHHLSTVLEKYRRATTPAAAENEPAVA